MNGKKQKFRLQFLQGVDSLLILLSFWLARLLRDGLAMVNWMAVPPLGSSLADIFWILALVVPLGPLVLERYGFYEYSLHKRPWASIRQMFHALVALSVVVAFGVIFAKLSASSRLTLAGAIPLSGLLLLLREAVTRRLIRRYISQDERLESVVFVGRPKDVQKMQATLPQAIFAEWRVVGVFDPHTRPVADLPDILHKHNVARVIFAAAHSSFDQVQEAVRACEVEGVEAWIFANFLQTSIAKPTFDYLGQQPMLVFRTTPEISWALLAKSIFDRCLALLALIFLAIPMLLIAATIRISDPGPALFRQKRSGRHGKPFTMLKFRTMVVDAEKRLAAIKESAGNEMSGPVFKLEKDPRIIPIGHWLRKASLDELPQFINVLMGDMSIVGPRPLPTYEVDEFTDMAHRRRLSVKPGLTCLWQISGRNEIKDFEDWVRLDLEYIDNWSLGLDFSILLRTIPVVLFGKGAH